MKKFLAVFLSVVAIICAFAGCSSGDSSTSGSGNSAETNASSLDYFEIYNNEITGLTEEGAKQKKLIIPENITSIDSFVFAPEYTTEGKSNEILEKGTHYSSDPMFFNIMGKNYQQLKQYDKAEYMFYQAIYRIPHKLYPYYLLMKMYIERR